MEDIHLWKKAPYLSDDIKNTNFSPYIRTFFIKDAKACVLICPGGGYEFLSDILEGKEIAEWLNSKKISAAVLYYRVKPYAHPHALIDAKRAMRLLRHNAETFGFPKNIIGIMGFSAGGHVAGCVSTHFEEEKNPADNIDIEDSRPDFQILCYPVITTDMTYAHQNSILLLLGKDFENEEIAEYYSVEKQVSNDTPPAFIWHTAEDDCVPVQNSLEYAKRLAEHRIPTELHIYPFGKHGTALKNVPHTEKWSKDLESWLNDIILK